MPTMPICMSNLRAEVITRLRYGACPLDNVPQSKATDQRLQFEGISVPLHGCYLN